MKHIKLKYKLMLSALVALFTSEALADTKSMQREVERYLSNCEQVSVCNGVFLVADKGKIIHHRAYGHDGSKDNNRLTTKHLFDIGSVSKQFTASAILRLRDQEKLDFDDLLNKYIPEIEYPGIKLRHLLNHTSGIPEVMKYFSELYRQNKINYPITNQRLISVLATQKPAKYFEPGNDWKYSNTGYYLLASVVERVSGLPYKQFLEQEFFEPLEMNSTRVYGGTMEKHHEDNRSYGFMERFDGAQKSFDQIPYYYLVGSGGIYSTTGDLFKWSKALSSEQLFSKDSWSQALRPTEYGKDKLKKYGFGWGLKPSKSGKKALKHSGDWRGFTAGFALYPEQEQTIIMLTNNNVHKGLNGVLDGLNHILAGQPVAPVKQSLSKALYPVLMNSEKQKAKEILNEASKPNNNKFYTDKRTINRLGYTLLEKGRVEDAIEVFKFNNKKYPGTANTYDSLAEAYARSREFSKAIELLNIMKKKFPLHMDYTKRQNELANLSGI